MRLTAKVVTLEGKGIFLASAVKSQFEIKTSTQNRNKYNVMAIEDSNRSTKIQYHEDMLIQYYYSVNA